jgi:hypothetical protein
MTKKRKLENVQGQTTHLSKCALADDLDRPEIPQTDLRPTEPQKLRLRAHMPLNVTQPAVVRYTRKRSVELSASTKLH